MPIFFDKNKLTDIQRSNWDFAVAEYARIQIANNKRLAQTKVGDNSASMLNAALNYHQPSEKSALFSRLLEGKEALEWEPPTSYSYPWYSVIEETGPFPVTFMGVSSETSRSGSQCLGGVTANINQALWQVESANSAAERLLDLERILVQNRSKVSTGPGQYDYEMIFDWNPAFLSSVSDAYKQKPEFLVKFGPWPKYRLFVGTSETHAAISFARSITSGGRLGIERTASVFDLMMLCLSPEIGDVVAKGLHPRIAHDALVLAAASGDSKSSTSYASLALEASKRNIDRECVEFELDPTCRDWVILKTLGWQISKSLE